ncbi:MAG TPA: hypothetical protein ENI11_01545 [Actinobacteria bacterium]|nr:hypothetical protein [Actinomycetota bacterium]
MKNIVIVVVVVVVAAVSFWGGTYYQRQQFGAGRRSFIGQGGPGGGFGGGNPGGRHFGGSGSARNAPNGQQRGTPIISGRLDKITDDELTLTTQRGTLKVATDDKVIVKHAEKVDDKDLETKKDVLIEVEFDDDGEMTAKTIIQ